MRQPSNRAAIGRATGGIWLAAMFLAGAPAAAHENHAPLPAKGVTVAGDTIMLSDKARAAIGLTTAKVAFGDIHRRVEAPARVELPWHAQQMITSLVAGKIERITVRPGDTVAAGQELARVASPELASLQMALLEAKAQVALATKLVEQRTRLGQQGAIAGKSLREAQTERAKQSAALAVARQKLYALGLDEAAVARIEATGEPLTAVAVTSPAAGVITHADVRVGQVVQPTDHLYHVVDPAQLWITGEVLEADIRWLKPGQAVEATFAALPGRVFPGKIDHLRLKVDRQTRTQPVVVAVENPEGALRPGMAGRLRIAVEVAREAVLCPADAVIRSRTGTYLLVQRMPGKYENRPVTLGLGEDGQVEITRGVFPGDQVVVGGSALLASLMGNEHKARVADGAGAAAGQTGAEPSLRLAHGTVELPTDRQALASARIEGRIARILVRPSEPVAAGQVLAEVESLALRSVQLDLLRALAQARLVEASLERLRGLSSQGFTPQRQVWELESELESLRLRADGLKRQLAFLGLTGEQVAALEQVDLTRDEVAAVLVRTLPVRAPAAGAVVDFRVVPGQVVRPEDTLFEIHNLARVWIKGFIPEREVGRIELGQGALVRFAAWPDLEVEGQVVRIAPLMDEQERVLPVWVEVENPEGLLRDGMIAQLTLHRGATAAKTAGAPRPTKK